MQLSRLKRAILVARQLPAVMIVALGINGVSSRRTVAIKLMQLRQSLRCGHTLRENVMTALGSVPGFAVRWC